MVLIYTSLFDLSRTTVPLFTTRRSQQRAILTDGFNQQQKIDYPGGWSEPLQYMLPQTLEQAPLPPLQLNKRYRLLEFLGYFSFRIGLLILLLIFALDMSGLFGEWQQSGGLLYQLITATETLAIIAILLSVLFRNSPMWLIEPPASGYIDKLVGRNPQLLQYRTQVRNLGRSETLMELALYEAYDQAQQQEIRQGGSRLKRQRQKKREQKRY